MTWDVAIVGGGPAGLSAAIRAARRGFKTVLFERSEGAPDKACGEGLMPSGQRQLHELGVRIPVDQCAEFHGIQYIQEDGRALTARFTHGKGLGIRRTALTAALRTRALESGAELRHASVDELIAPGKLLTSEGPIEARLVIAADGLHSPLRRAAGLERPSLAQPRFGLRRHFAVKPWTDLVEVHWAGGVEAYLTPTGPATTNVAFLFWQKGGFDSLLAKFPRLQERLHGAQPESEVRGAGPLLQRVTGRTADRLALLGDAAGYVDAITGQGLTLALHSSALLFDLLPQDLSGALPLQQYEAALRAPWRRYALPAAALVALSQRPRARRAALNALRIVPGAFTALVNGVG